MSSSAVTGCISRLGVVDLNRPTAGGPVNSQTHLTTLTHYNAAGDRVSVTDPAGVVTTYEYDLLDRLTAVVENAQAGQPADNYTNVRTAYGYDAVGNRLARITQVSGIPSTMSYSYDAANRQTAVNTTTYTWDNNGNLTNNGNTFTYDAASRLTGLTQGNTTYAFSYNALSDRVSQTVNDTTSTYVLDLEAGLTQVLYDGTNVYLYGNGRIAQQQGSTILYYEPGALGSVRQLTSAAGALGLARLYDLTF